MSNPQFTADLDGEALAFLQEWADGDFTLITDAFDQARAALSGVPRSTLLVDVQGLDGNGGTLRDDIEQAFADADARLAELLWSENNGLFTSSTFTVDPTPEAGSFPERI